MFFSRLKHLISFKLMDVLNHNVNRTKKCELIILNVPYLDNLSLHTQLARGDILRMLKQKKCLLCHDKHMLMSSIPTFPTVRLVIYC